MTSTSPASLTSRQRVVQRSLPLLGGTEAHQKLCSDCRLCSCALTRPEPQHSHHAMCSFPHTSLLWKLMRFLSDKEKPSLYLEDLPARSHGNKAKGSFPVSPCTTSIYSKSTAHLPQLKKILRIILLKQVRPRTEKDDIAAGINRILSRLL